MKKIISLTALFIVAISQAQDYDLIKSLTQGGNEKQAIGLAENIAASSPVTLRLFKSKEFADDHAYVVRFIPAALTDQQYSALDESEQDGFLTVKFDVSATGTKSYKFKQATGQYAFVAPFWSKYFHPSADARKIATDSKLQKFVDRSKNVDFYFQEDNEGWILRNQS